MNCVAFLAGAAGGSIGKRSPVKVPVAVGAVREIQLLFRRSVSVARSAANSLVASLERITGCAVIEIFRGNLKPSRGGVAVRTICPQLSCMGIGVAVGTCCMIDRRKPPVFGMSGCLCVNNRDMAFFTGDGLVFSGKGKFSFGMIKTRSRPPRLKRVATFTIPGHLASVLIEMT